MIHLKLQTNKKRSRLEKEAERLISDMFLRDSGRRVSMKPGAYIEKHGHKYNLKDLRAKHFDLRNAYPQNRDND